MNSPTHNPKGNKITFTVFFTVFPPILYAGEKYAIYFSTDNWRIHQLPGIAARLSAEQLRLLGGELLFGENPLGFEGT